MSHSLLEAADRHYEILKASTETPRSQAIVGIRRQTTYAFRIDVDQARCRAIKQLADEGFLDEDRLLSGGMDHQTASNHLEAFDRYLYTRWEAELVVKNEDERKAQYRLFLRERTRTWREEYARWLASPSTR
jgi:hypothetical protein